jgi:hypothetical protein
MFAPRGTVLPQTLRLIRKWASFKNRKKGEASCLAFFRSRTPELPISMAASRIPFRSELCEGSQPKRDFPRVASATEDVNCENTPFFRSCKGTIIALQSPSEIPIAEWSVEVRLLLNSRAGMSWLECSVAIPEWKYRARS